MKSTKLRRFLPIILTLLTVIICTIGVTAAAAQEEERSNQLKHVNIVLDNDVDLVFWADISEDVAKRASTVVVFNDEKTVRYSGTKTLNDVTYAIYRYENVSPQDLSDVINVKLYVRGNLTSSLDYSVKDYCQYILSNADNDSLKTLVSDLLLYGAESQTLNGESEESLVTNGVTNLTPSKAPEKMTVLYDQQITEDLTRGASASLTDSKLVMSNGIELHFNVDLPKGDDPAEYTVCLSVNGREQEVPVLSKATVTGYDNRVSFKGIYSYELFDVIQVNVYKNNVRVSNSMSFSVASYIEALNKDPNYAAVTSAYYNYCYSSHIYAGTHTIVMPGEITGNDMAGIMYDDDGIITYKCSLCGLDASSVPATHIRTFETGNITGSPSNSGTYTTTNDNGETVTKSGSLFTLATPAEVAEDGSTNTYLSILRDVEENLATSGSFGYYVVSGHVRPSAVKDYVDSKGQYTSSKFTIMFDVKAPEAGMTDTAVHLRNTHAPSGEGNGRFGELLTIDANGSINRGSIKIAPVGTVSSDEWSKITITLDLYNNDDGTPYIYLEYYLGNELLSSFSTPNPMQDAKFTDIHFSMGIVGISNGQGILLDNIVLAQDCVHSFAEDIKSHVSNVEGGNLRGIIDKVQNDFDIEDFSYVVRWDGRSSYTTKEYQSFVSLDRNKYSDPLSTPKNYDHPRLLFNSKDIPNIVANIDAEENALAKAAFLALVNTSTDGKLTPTSDIKPASFEWTNYDVSVLRVIEAKAFYYAIYKDSASVSSDDARLRGYEAIYAMKNYLLTFDVQWKASDQCRYYGEMMYYAALVYDWCYDLLTEADKQQFMVGVQNLACDGTNNMPWAKREGATGTQNGVALNTHEARKLEGGFPALAVEMQSSLTGHGAEAQVIRDYFAFSIAIYDEDSSWYDYVGGLIYQNYVDARNYFYTSGFYPDGSAGYNEYRFLCDMYNAWLFKSMGAEFPYNEENMSSVVHGLTSMETYDGFMFATGDGAGTAWTGTDQYRLPDNIGDAALISAHLFKDPTALAIAHHILDYRWGRGSFSSSQLGISAAYYLILTSDGMTPSEDYREKINNVEYHGAFQQQVIARNGYGEDSAVVLMQGGQHLPGGHTHQNAGSFQIWYKGMLTRDDGLYDAYGSDHHHYYHAAAVAHNTLLIYNNDLKDASAEPVGRTGFYNGGQRAYLGIPTTYSAWIKDNRFSYGQVIGMQTDDETNPSYVYFANDITNAYEDVTVDYVERSFMTLYTGDTETPMVMFVFDNITADSPDFRKTFLLQCATEPTVDKENGVITVDNGEGKLVLTSLLGGDQIKAYGRTSINGEVGEGINGNGSERFWLSGQDKNLAPGGAGSIGDKASDLSILWGHAEISANTGNATNQLVNVLYVSDSGTTVSATPTLIEGNGVTGATFKNHTSVFVNDRYNRDVDMSFVSTADEGITTMTYYIGGLAEGDWKIFIEGEQIYAKDAEGNDTDFTVTEDGKMISFTGKVGEVRIEPGENMRPKGAVKLAYNLNGGNWEGETPLNYYMPGTEFVLPIPVKPESTFGGWFTDKEFTNQLVAIPADSTEAYVLYAKWSSPILHVDYTQGGSLSDHNKVSYSPESSGADWQVINDTENYLLWKNKASGGIIGYNGALGKYKTQSYQVSYIITLGRNGTDPLLPLSLYGRDDGHGNKIYLNLFKTDASGKAYLGDGKVYIGDIASSGPTTFRFVLNFENGKIIAYDENGKEIVKKNMSDISINPPFGFTYKTWYEDMTSSSNSIMSLKGGGSGTIRVYGLTILSGSLADSCKNFGPSSTLHNWDTDGDGVDDYVITQHPSETDCTPGTMVYTCTECEITKTVPLTSDNTHASITHTLNDANKLVYTCTACNCTYTPGASVYLDGSSYDSIVGVGNAENFNTKEGTSQPIINAGAYELINNTGNSGNIELWVPGRTPILSGFSSENNSIGFVSFRINALTTDKFDFTFVDTSSEGSKWSPDWCITDAFFRVFAPKTSGGKTTVKITGWDSMELANIDVASNVSFTGWIDVKIYVTMNSATDEITLDYYINGNHVGSASRELTTSTNAINSICISGSTAAINSGIKLDEIAIGYTPNGAWELAK